MTSPSPSFLKRTRREAQRVPALADATNAKNTQEQGIENDTPAPCHLLKDMTKNSNHELINYRILEETDLLVWLFFSKLGPRLVLLHAGWGRNN